MIRFPQKLIWCSDRSVITIAVSGQSLVQSFPNLVAKLNIFSLRALIGNLRFYRVLLEYRELISYGLFRLEIHIVFGLRQHDLQLHVLNFFNFTLYALWRIVTIFLLEKAV